MPPPPPPPIGGTFRPEGPGLFQGRLQGRSQGFLLGAAVEGFFAERKYTLVTILTVQSGVVRLSQDVTQYSFADYAIAADSA